MSVITRIRKILVGSRPPMRAILLCSGPGDPTAPGHACERTPAARGTAVVPGSSRPAEVDRDPRGAEVLAAQNQWK